MSSRMTRLLLAALLTVVVALVGVTTTGAQEEPPATTDPATTTTQDKPPVPECATPKQHKREVKKALRFSAVSGNFVAKKRMKFVREASDMRACAKEYHPYRYKLMLKRWEKRKAEFRFYRKIDRITPYGAWAKPASVVYCESKFSWRASNPSGAIGPYQLLGKGAPWPVNSVHDMAVHHEIAASLGLSHWNASRSCWGR